MNFLFWVVPGALFLTISNVNFGSTNPRHITTQDVQIRVDENMAMALQNLFMLESMATEVKDPEVKKIVQLRINSLEKEISVVSQDILHDAIGKCRSSDTIPGDISLCTEDPSSYVMDKFGPLYYKIDELTTYVQLHSQ